ncbi:MAG TPA: energy transducer TonB [Candidatus Acidoferrum sp.]
MKRLLAVSILFLLTIFVIKSGIASAAKEPPHFAPPNVLKAGPIPYPASSLDAGVVTLSINLDNAGQIARVNILRDLSSVSGLAISAVHSWTFSPATLDGKPVPSNLVANIVYDPGFLGADNIPLPPPAQVQPITKNGPAYLPAQLTNASFAPYPQKTKAQDSVVFNVSLDANGNVAKVATLRDVPPLTASALGALKKWSFSPATYDGNPIVSTMVVAIVFHSPSATIPQ